MPRTRRTRAGSSHPGRQVGQQAQPLVLRGRQGRPGGPRPGVGGDEGVGLGPGHDPGPGPAGPALTPSQDERLRLLAHLAARV